jgi:hypothetical protein
MTEISASRDGTDTVTIDFIQFLQIYPWSDLLFYRVLWKYKRMLGAFILDLMSSITLAIDLRHSPIGRALSAEGCLLPS